MIDRFVLAAAALWMAAMSPCCVLAEDAQQDLAGLWQGTLKVGVAELRLLVRIKLEDGQLSGTMDSLDQGAKDIPIQEVTIKNGEVTLKVAVVGGVFSGKLEAGKRKLSGTWRQGGLSLPLELERTEKEIQLNRPQEPAPPLPYGQEEVVFESAPADVKLAGTLTLPEGQGPFPAVVLVSGSGPQDRDESLMGHRPFLVLADSLTRRGIAVLRYDDRGFAKSTGDFGSATTLDFKDDALAAVRFLKSHGKVDAGKIGICGHSEGGLVAPLAAVESPDVAFIVLMAGPGVTGEEIIYKQSTLLLETLGVDAAVIERNQTLLDRLCAIVKGESNASVIAEKTAEAISEFKAGLPEKDRKEFETQEGVVQGQLKMFATPWFRWFLTYDPQPTLTKVTCPVLAITGERDLQVDPAQNLPVIERVLASAGHRNFTVRELPELNHLFQTCETGSVTEYGRIEETMAPLALKAIGSWIEQQTKD